MARACQMVQADLSNKELVITGEELGVGVVKTVHWGEITIFSSIGARLTCL